MNGRKGVLVATRGMVVGLIVALIWMMSGCESSDEVKGCAPFLGGTSTIRTTFSWIWMP